MEPCTSSLIQCIGKHATVAPTDAFPGPDNTSDNPGNEGQTKRSADPALLSPVRIGLGEHEPQSARMEFAHDQVSPEVNPGRKAAFGLSKPCDNGGKIVYQL